MLACTAGQVFLKEPASVSKWYFFPAGLQIVQHPPQESHVGQRILNLQHFCVCDVVHAGRLFVVLHGEGSTGPVTPRNQNRNQPSRGHLQEAVRTQRNQTKSHPDKPTQRHSDPTHSSTLSRVKYVSTPIAHVYRDAPAGTRSSEGRPHSTCSHKPSQPAEGVDAM